jgi:spermidine/putrescine transport system substrate-binding protein
MTIHPRESRYGRREFLGRSAAGVVGLSSLSTILAACGGSDNGNFKPPELQLARPDSPVTWPLLDDNPMIASGLEPESGTLRIYNWNGYLWPRIKKDFGKEYGVKVEESFFDTLDEAIAKISSGAVDFDVFFPTPDRLGRLVVGKVLQPLNHDYLPNLANVWPSVQDPWYDKESRYTVPYVTWTTGIGYRTDHVQTTPDKLSNPYEIYWDETNRGKTFLLDDGRDAPAHMLLKNGIENINTEDPDDIALAKEELKSLIGAVNVKLSTNDYTNLPEGKAWVHQTWSGSAISAQWYLPEGTGPEALGFWFPEDGRGTIGNDNVAIPRNAKHPVLAHHFLNYLLDNKHGYDNFSNYVGYQPPFTRLDPDRLIADGVVPANLKTAIVRESDFDQGYFLTELTPAGQTEWQNAWAEFKAGV